MAETITQSIGDAVTLPATLTPVLTAAGNAAPPLSPDSTQAVTPLPTRLALNASERNPQTSTSAPNLLAAVLVSGVSVFVLVGVLALLARRLRTSRF